MYERILNNQQQLSECVSHYLQQPENEILVVFGHILSDKTDTIKSVAEESHVDLKYVDSKDLQPIETYDGANLFVSTYGEEAQACLTDLLHGNLTFPCIVEVSLTMEGEAREIILKNQNLFKWVYYREEQTGLDNLVLSFIQEKESNAIKEAHEALCKAFVVAEKASMDELYDLLIKQVLQKVATATLDDKVFRDYVNLSLTALTPVFERTDMDEKERAKFVKLGVILHKHMPYIS